jgi:hypothetical protein
MKSYVLVGALAASAAIAIPLSANALSFSVLASSTNNSGNQAHVFAADYGVTLPGGAFWVPLSVPNTINPPPTNIGSAFLSPFANTDLGDDTLTTVNGSQDRSYFVVQPNPIGGFPASDDPAKLNLGGIKTSFSLLWGSIDEENKISFELGGAVIGSVTGQQVAAGRTGCLDDFNLVSNSRQCVAKVVFTDTVGFDTVIFSAGTAEGGARNSFEFATIPLPAAAWMLLGVSGALVAAKRRASKNRTA